MNKSYRQGQILNLVRSRRLHTQEEVAKELRALGIAATQVTLSRDIRELGLVKTSQGYSQNSTATSGGREVASLAREFLLEVKLAQNLLVLRTPSATASMLAEALDHAHWPEITGTIAGDNTVLVIAPDAQAAQTLQAKLLSFLG